MAPDSEFDLICFDVDGTLVAHPTGKVIWEVLNLRYGGSEELNRRRYEMHRRGELSYDDWVRLDVEDWIVSKATRREILESVGEFSLIEGASDAVFTLKERGFKLAVISGTLDVVLDAFFPDHPFDVVYTNKLGFGEEGRLESWQATPFDGRGKPDALRRIARSFDIPLSRSAFIGDGENDVPLLGVAGYFVAYQPRSEALKRGADIVIYDNGLHGLLDIFRK